MKLTEKRKFFLIQACVALVLISARKFMGLPENLDFLVKSLFKSVLLWSCTMTALGYFVSLFNFDNRYRKVLNEAIYPFYLLQQPVIVVIAYYVVEWRLPVLVKVPALIILSLISIILIYMSLIKPFRMTRLIFGLKPSKKKPYAIRYASYKLAKLMNTLF
jgi:peptidoglycan/LPS O-acetylase OafA/YrhL